MRVMMRHLRRLVLSAAAPPRPRWMHPVALPSFTIAAPASALTRGFAALPVAHAAAVAAATAPARGTSDPPPPQASSASSASSSSRRAPSTRGATAATSKLPPKTKSKTKAGTTAPLPVYPYAMPATAWPAWLTTAYVADTLPATFIENAAALVEATADPAGAARAVLETALAHDHPESALAWLRHLRITDFVAEQPGAFALLWSGFLAYVLRAHRGNDRLLRAAFAAHAAALPSLTTRAHLLALAPRHHSVSTTSTVFTLWDEATSASWDALDDSAAEHERSASRRLLVPGCPELRSQHIVAFAQAFVQHVMFDAPVVQKAASVLASFGPARGSSDKPSRNGESGELVKALAALRQQFRKAAIPTSTVPESEARLRAMLTAMPVAHAVAVHLVTTLLASDAPLSVYTAKQLFPVEPMSPSPYPLTAYASWLDLLAMRAVKASDEWRTFVQVLCVCAPVEIDIVPLFQKNFPATAASAASAASAVDKTRVATVPNTLGSELMPDIQRIDMALAEHVLSLFQNLRGTWFVSHDVLNALIVRLLYVTQAGGSNALALYTQAGYLCHDSHARALVAAIERLPYHPHQPWVPAVLTHLTKKLSFRMSAALEVADVTAGATMKQWKSLLRVAEATLVAFQRYDYDPSIAALFLATLQKACASLLAADAVTQQSPDARDHLRFVILAVDAMLHRTRPPLASLTPDEVPAGMAVWKNVYGSFMTSFLRHSMTHGGGDLSWVASLKTPQAPSAAVAQLPYQPIAWPGSDPMTPALLTALPALRLMLPVKKMTQMLSQSTMPAASVRQLRSLIYAQSILCGQLAPTPDALGQCGPYTAWITEHVRQRDDRSHASATAPPPVLVDPMPPVDTVLLSYLLNQVATTEPHYASLEQARDDLRRFGLTPTVHNINSELMLLVKLTDRFDAAWALFVRSFGEVPAASPSAATTSDHFTTTSPATTTTTAATLCPDSKTFAQLFNMLITMPAESHHGVGVDQRAVILEKIEAARAAFGVKRDPRLWAAYYQAVCYVHGHAAAADVRRQMAAVPSEASDTNGMHLAYLAMHREAWQPTSAQQITDYVLAHMTRPDGAINHELVQSAALMIARFGGVDALNAYLPAVKQQMSSADADATLFSASIQLQCKMAACDFDGVDEILSQHAKSCLGDVYWLNYYLLALFPNVRDDSNATYLTFEPSETPVSDAASPAQPDTLAELNQLARCATVVERGTNAAEETGVEAPAAMPRSAAVPMTTAEVEAHLARVMQHPWTCSPNAYTVSILYRLLSHRCVEPLVSVMDAWMFAACPDLPVSPAPTPAVPLPRILAWLTQQPCTPSLVHESTQTMYIDNSAHRPGATTTDVEQAFERVRWITRERTGLTAPVSNAWTSRIEAHCHLQNPVMATDLLVTLLKAAMAPATTTGASDPTAPLSGVRDQLPPVTRKLFNNWYGSMIGYTAWADADAAAVTRAQLQRLLDLLDTLDTATLPSRDIWSRLLSLTLAVGPAAQPVRRPLGSSAA